MLHAPAQRDISMKGIGQVSPECQGMLCVWRAWDRLGPTGLHRCMVSCKIFLFLVEADIEHTVNATLNTHWTQSKKLQIAANLCSWLWFSEKSTNIEFSFDFHRFALSLSFLSVLCLVHCMFNVRSMYVHCQLIASAYGIPVVKSMRSVKEGVGSVTGCILNSAFAALSLQLLQREHFAQGTSRKSISFSFRPAGHIHIQHTHSLHATMLHAPAQRDISMKGIGQVSPECQGMLCVWRAWDRLGPTGLHRCMVSCKIFLFLVEADIEHTVNATLNTHWTQSKKLQIAANLCSWLWFSEKSTNIEFSFDFHRFALSLSFLSVLCLVHCMFNVRSMYVHCQLIASAYGIPVVKSMRSVKEGVGSVTGCILNSAFKLCLCNFCRESTLLRVRLGKAFLFRFGPQATFTSNTPTHCTRPCFTHLRKGI